jgi:hypothetical protein
MVDPIEPTAKEPVIEPTAAQPKEPDTAFKTFASKKEHDDYINVITKERLEREKKKYADYDTLKERSEKLKEFENKDLTDVQKLQKEHEKATLQVSDLTKELTGIRLENAKLKALVKAGVQPEQLDGLLKRVAGTTEEEIFSDVEELKTLGWIGKQPTPESKPTGLGTQTKTGEPTKKSTLKDRMAEINIKMSDPKTSRRELDALSKESISILRRIQAGET